MLESFVYYVKKQLQKIKIKANLTLFALEDTLKLKIAWRFHLVGILMPTYTPLFIHSTSYDANMHQSQMSKI